jgi:hypothetical protein
MFGTQYRIWYDSRYRLMAEYRPPALQGQRVLQHEVQDNGEHEVPQPQAGAEVKEGKCFLGRAAEPGHIGPPGDEELRHIDAGQADE